MHVFILLIIESGNDLISKKTLILYVPNDLFLSFMKTNHSKTCQTLVLCYFYTHSLHALPRGKLLNIQQIPVFCLTFYANVVIISVII